MPSSKFVLSTKPLSFHAPTTVAAAATTTNDQRNDDDRSTRKTTTTTTFSLSTTRPASRVNPTGTAAAAATGPPSTTTTRTTTRTTTTPRPTKFRVVTGGSLLAGGNQSSRLAVPVTTTKQSQPPQQRQRQPPRVEFRLATTTTRSTATTNSSSVATTRAAAAAAATTTTTTNAPQQPQQQLSPSASSLHTDSNSNENNKPRRFVYMDGPIQFVTPPPPQPPNNSNSRRSSREEEEMTTTNTTTTLQAPPPTTTTPDGRIPLSVDTLFSSLGWIDLATLPDSNSATMMSTASTTTPADNNSNLATDSSGSCWWPCLAFTRYDDAMDVLRQIYPLLKGRNQHDCGITNNDNNNTSMKEIHRLLCLGMVEEWSNDDDDTDTTTTPSPPSPSSSSSIVVVVPLVGNGQSPNQVHIIDRSTTTTMKVVRLNDPNVWTIVKEQMEYHHRQQQQSRTDDGSSAASSLSSSSFHHALQEFRRLTKLQMTLGLSSSRSMASSSSPFCIANRSSNKSSSTRKRGRNNDDENSSLRSNPDNNNEQVLAEPQRPNKFQRYTSSPLENHFQRRTSELNVSRSQNNNRRVEKTKTTDNTKTKTTKKRTTFQIASHPVLTVGDRSSSTTAEQKSSSTSSTAVGNNHSKSTTKTKSTKRTFDDVRRPADGRPTISLNTSSARQSVSRKSSSTTTNGPIVGTRRRSNRFNISRGGIGSMFLRHGTTTSAAASAISATTTRSIRTNTNTDATSHQSNHSNVEPNHHPNRNNKRLQQKEQDSMMNLTTRSTNTREMERQEDNSRTTLSSSSSSSSKTRRTKQHNRRSRTGETEETSPHHTATPTSRQSVNATPPPSSLKKPPPKPVREVWKNTGETIKVPKWDTVRKLLDQLGHVFRPNMFCRPFGDPTIFEGVTLGVDYFESFTEYRDYLCVHGIDYAGAIPWEENAKEIETLTLWVRCTVVLDTKKDMRSIDLQHLYIDRPTALRLLKEIGVKWTNAKNGLVEGYLLPGDPTKELRSEADLWVYLIRHGLPKECHLDAIDANCRTALELSMAQGDVYKWISKHKHLRLFKRNEKERQRKPSSSPKTIVRPRRDRGMLSSKSRREQSVDATPVGDKAALEAVTRAPEGTESPHRSLTSVTRQLLTDVPDTTNDTRGNTEQVAQEETRNSHSTGERAKKRPKRNAENSDRESREDQTIESRKESSDMDVDSSDDRPESTNSTVHDSESHSSQAVVVQQSHSQSSSTKATSSGNDKSNTTNDESDVEFEDKEFDVSIPGKTIRQKLRNSLAAMRKDHSDRIVPTSKLSSSLVKLRKFLKAVVQSKGRQGGKDVRPILYLCGSPGTGKTMSTKQLCDDVIAAYKTKMDDWEEAPKSFYLNCSQIQGFSKRDAIQKVLGTMKVTNKSRLVQPADEAKGYAMILILDEIDLLCGSAGTENCLRTLIEWASDTGNKLSIIGISNSIQDAKSRRLVDLGMSGNKIVFNAYRKEELVKITESKIGFSVFDKKAMEFIAAKVSASSGDARKYLELVCLTISRCLDKLPVAKLDAELPSGSSDNNSSSDKVKPIVTIRDAMLAIRETNVKYKDIIESLSFLDKVTLCTGVHLSRKLDSRPVTLRHMMHLIVDCGGVEMDIGTEDLKDSVERLYDSGLLTLENFESGSFSSMGMGLQNMPVRFDLQLEDVESALEEWIKTESFFQRLVERVKDLQC